MSRDEAESIADKMVQRFNNPMGREFYLKCAYKLPEGKIMHLLEIAMTKQKPANYFSVAAKREIEGSH